MERARCCMETPLRCMSTSLPVIGPRREVPNAAAEFFLKCCAAAHPSPQQRSTKAFEMRLAWPVHPMASQPDLQIYLLLRQALAPGSAVPRPSPPGRAVPLPVGASDAEPRAERQSVAGWTLSWLGVVLLRLCLASRRLASVRAGFSFCFCFCFGIGGLSSQRGQHGDRGRCDGAGGHGLRGGQRDHTGGYFLPRPRSGTGVWEGGAACLSPHRVGVRALVLPARRSAGSVPSVPVWKQSAGAPLARRGALLPRGRDDHALVPQGGLRERHVAGQSAAQALALRRHRRAHLDRPGRHPRERQPLLPRLGPLRRGHRAAALLLLAAAAQRHQDPRAAAEHVQPSRHLRGHRLLPQLLRPQCHLPVRRRPVHLLHLLRGDHRAALPPLPRRAHAHDRGRHEVLEGPGAAQPGRDQPQGRGWGRQGAAAAGGPEHRELHPPDHADLPEQDQHPVRAPGDRGKDRLRKHGGRLLRQAEGKARGDQGLLAAGARLRRGRQVRAGSGPERDAAAQERRQILRHVRAAPAGRDGDRALQPGQLEAVPAEQGAVERAAAIPCRHRRRRRRGVPARQGSTHHPSGSQGGELLPLEEVHGEAGGLRGEHAVCAAPPGRGGP
eukprot:scaffold149_cov315-Pinguiococcus_pyrenoidosus.AAC.12